MNQTALDVVKDFRGEKCSRGQTGLAGLIQTSRRTDCETRRKGTQLCNQSETRPFINTFASIEFDQRQRCCNGPNWTTDATDWLLKKEFNNYYCEKMSRIPLSLPPYPSSYPPYIQQSLSLLCRCPFFSHLESYYAIISTRLSTGYAAFLNYRFP